MNFKFKSLTNAGVKTFEELVKIQVFSEFGAGVRDHAIIEVFNEACNEIERLEREAKFFRKLAEVSQELRELEGLAGIRK